jgi:hypothetical protein
MLSRRAAVDYSGIAHLGLERRELLIGTPTIGAVYNSDLIGLQLGVKKIEQIAPSDGVDQHRIMFDRSSLIAHAVAIAIDLKANHARTKGLIQRLGVARVIAEICDNESVATVATINGSQRAGARTAIEALWQLFALLDTKQPRLKGAVTPTTAVERSRLRPTSCAMMSGLKTGQVLGSSRLNLIALLPSF